MAISAKLQQYLASKQLEYDIVPHPETMSSMPTAEACHIPGDRLAKGVVLRTKDGYVLAVLPATYKLNPENLKEQLGDDFSLASEEELGELFEDCARGAVPAAGEAYGLKVLLDDSIREQPDIYFEGGDHATAVHMSGLQFARLMENARRAHFGVHV
jgi:Ala-tRNA(Pro) deacylase